MGNLRATLEGLKVLYLKDQSKSCLTNRIFVYKNNKPMSLYFLHPGPNTSADGGFLGDVFLTGSRPASLPRLRTEKWKLMMLEKSEHSRSVYSLMFVLISQLQSFWFPLSLGPLT